MSTRATNALGRMPKGRMLTLDEMIVRAPPAAIFDLAAHVEQWPSLLPHYRYVRFRERKVGGGIVEMSANRPFGVVQWPTWWVSMMDTRPYADQPDHVIRFRHIEGVTTRMEVEWAFTPVTGGTHVTVVHVWDGPAWPMIGTIAAKAVIGPVFVHGIASRTLAGLANAAERRQSSLNAEPS